MQLRYAAWYVAFFAPSAFIPWICGSDDSTTVLVISMEFVVMAPARALSARTWSPVVGEALPVLAALGASSLHPTESAAGGNRPSAACGAASERRRIKGGAPPNFPGTTMLHHFNNQDRSRVSPDKTRGA